MQRYFKAVEMLIAIFPSKHNQTRPYTNPATENRSTCPQTACTRLLSILHNISTKNTSKHFKILPPPPDSGHLTRW